MADLFPDSQYCGLARRGWPAPASAVWVAPSPRTRAAAPYPLKAWPIRAYPESNETMCLRVDVMSCCLCNDTAWRVVAGPQWPPTCGGGRHPLPPAAPYQLQARPVCAYSAPNETLRLRGDVIDCCLRNDAAWRVVAGPQLPSTSGGGRRPLPYPRCGVVFTSSPPHVHMPCAQ